MPAMLVYFSCDASAYDGAYDEQLVLSVRLRKNRSPICYQIGMRTTVGPTEQGGELFGKLASGFGYIK
jgi:hypothetical protein